VVQTGTAEMLTLCGRPVTSSIRSSLASLSGSVDSFHVRVRCRDRGGQRATANLGGGRAGLAAAEELIYQWRSLRREYGRGVQHAMMWAHYATARRPCSTVTSTGCATTGSLNTNG
jgi:hypothetical protein